jgi:ubiquinone/menaquinone biosynthesis C-methylase UbiE
MLNVEPYLKRSPLILELGCGGAKKDRAAIGVDLLDLPGVDITGEALEVLSAFPDSSVDSVYSEHFMEHVQQPHSILREAARVLKPGGEFRAIVPHFSNPWFYSDPTHWSHFGLYTFCYWVTKTPFRRQVPHYEKPLPFELLSARHAFKSAPPFYFRHGIKKVLSCWVNLTHWTQEFYEESLSQVMSCYEIDYRLRKLS